MKLVIPYNDLNYYKWHADPIFKKNCTLHTRYEKDELNLPCFTYGTVRFLVVKIIYAYL